MYSSIRGTVQQVANNIVWLEANNYGYEIILVTNKEIILAEKEIVQIYTSLINNDYANNKWFGFYNLETKKIFFDLLSIPSIGLKTTILILQQVGVEELLTMVKENRFDLLVNIKGLRTNTARVLLTNLQKIYFRKEYNNLQNNIINCLKELGYSLPIIYQALHQIPTPPVNLDQYLKIILQKVGSFVQF